MIFFGAGASQPFGIPTLKKMSELVFIEMEKKGYGDILIQIKDSLTNFNMPINFESVYTILEGLNNPEKGIKQAGPFAAYLLKEKKERLKKDDLEELLLLSKKIVYDNCNIKNNEIKNMISTYDELFLLLHKLNIQENIIYTGSNLILNIGKIIATTNYDMSLELYFTSKKYRPIDGFISTPGETDIYTKKFAWNIIYNPLNMGDFQNNPLIIKLHGSIWQYEQKNPITGKVSLIKTNIDPKSFPIPILIEKEMMIYPTKEKEILSENYYHFYNCYKNIIWDKLLVIGYSFNDDPINLVIEENMKNNEKAQIIT